MDRDKESKRCPKGTSDNTSPRNDGKLGWADRLIDDCPTSHSSTIGMDQLEIPEVM